LTHPGDGRDAAIWIATATACFALVTADLTATCALLADTLNELPHEERRSSNTASHFGAGRPRANAAITSRISAGLHGQGLTGRRESPRSLETTSMFADRLCAFDAVAVSAQQFGGRPAGRISDRRMLCPGPRPVRIFTGL